MPWTNVSSAPTTSARCRRTRDSRLENPTASRAMNATTNSRNSRLEKTPASPASSPASKPAMLLKLICSEGGPDLVLADPERRQPGPEVVDQLREAVLVGRQDRREPGDRQRQRRREAQDQGEQRDERDGHRQPHRRTAPAQDPGQRMHADDEDEREQDRCDDRGELLQRQDGDQQSGHAQQHDQATRHQPTLRSGASGSITR